MPIPLSKTPETRINERIRVPQVRVIGDDGEQIGVIATREALAMAQSKGLDLVEVSPTARPPVCRIMDYGKFKYEQNRRARKARKNQHVMHLKEVKMRPKIDDHDYGVKMDHHQEIGHQLIQKIIAELAEVASVEQYARSEGRTLTMVMMPKPVQQQQPTPKPAAKPESKNASAPAESKNASAQPESKNVSAAPEA